MNTTQEMNFGGFAIEFGSANITMNSSGGLSSIGPVSLSNSIPATTWNMNVDNTLDVFCATYGFTLDWRKLPSDLRGPGANIPLNNVLVSIPSYGLNNATLPQTIAPSAGNTAPFTIVLYGEIAVTSPQTDGEYSRQQMFQFTQSNRSRSVRASVFATSFVPLGIAETVPMDFGTVAGGIFPGTVVLGPGNSRFVTGDAQILTSGPGIAASFEISGEPNQIYALSYSGGTLANAGGQQLTLTSFTDNSLGTLPGGGIEVFQVGATLNIGSSQPAGLYSTGLGGGSPYTVTINYN